MERRGLEGEGERGEGEGKGRGEAVVLYYCS
jgi:hypothetical protein